MELGSEHDLAEIITRVQSGDQQAFNAIVERFADPLFRYVCARCGDVSLAEELTGELWVRVVEHLPKFRFRNDLSDAVFAAWLYRIARNLLVDSYRRPDGKNLSLIDTIPSVEAALDEKAIDDEERRELHTAMAALTPEQREVVLFRFMEDRKIDEVATLMGRSIGAVKTLQYRALHALARALGIQRLRKPDHEAFDSD